MYHNRISDCRVLFFYGCSCFGIIKPDGSPGPTFFVGAANNALARKLQQLSATTDSYSTAGVDDLAGKITIVIIIMMIDMVNADFKIGLCAIYVCVCGRWKSILYHNLGRNNLVIDFRAHCWLMSNLCTSWMVVTWKVIHKCIIWLKRFSYSRIMLWNSSTQSSFRQNLSHIQRSRTKSSSHIDGSTEARHSLPAYLSSTNSTNINAEHVEYTHIRKD